jgi:hypothetical protein
MGDERLIVSLKISERLAETRPKCCARWRMLPSYRAFERLKRLFWPPLDAQRPANHPGIIRWLLSGRWGRSTLGRRDGKT